VKIQVASDDRDLHRLCREVLSEVVGTGWTLHVADKTAADGAADLYLWDINGEWDNSRIITAEDKWRHFVIVSRNHTQKIRSSLTDVQILLKPVTKAALCAFLAHACQRLSGNSLHIEEARSIAEIREDRDKLLQLLIQANLKLQEYDQDRTNFLARAIHDFRAPLTSISGYCGLLLGEELGTISAEQREVLERIYRSARKLSRMASGMFQLSVAPRAEITLDLRNGDFKACLEHALNEILPGAEDKRISIELDLGTSPEPLSFEPMKMEQVILNLLDNACKFTPRSGRIRIKGYPFFWERRSSGHASAPSLVERRAEDHHQPNCYRVDISDSGPGIAPANLPRIFEEYTSYGGGPDRSGGGLGLAICRMIVQQHKGKIWAENNSQGAVFSFVLPFPRTAPDMEDARVRKAQAAI
jgi:signal transduction histidine kinase